MFCLVLWIKKRIYNIKFQLGGIFYASNHTTQDPEHFTLEITIGLNVANVANLSVISQFYVLA